MLKEFEKDYKRICKKHGYSIIGVPVWEYDDGEWKLEVELQLKELIDD